MSAAVVRKCCEFCSNTWVDGAPSPAHACLRAMGSTTCLQDNIHHQYQHAPIQCTCWRKHCSGTCLQCTDQKGTEEEPRTPLTIETDKRRLLVKQQPLALHIATMKACHVARRETFLSLSMHFLWDSGNAAGKVACSA